MDLRKGAAFVLLVTYWLVVTLGSQFSIDLPGLLDDVWGSGAPGVAGFALGLGVGLYVGRWWVAFGVLVRRGLGPRGVLYGS